MQQIAEAHAFAIEAGAAPVAAFGAGSGFVGHGVFADAAVKRRNDLPTRGRQSRASLISVSAGRLDAAAPVEEAIHGCEDLIDGNLAVAVRVACSAQ